MNLLIQDFEASRETLQGLISISLLASSDGKNVVEYWQFEQAAFAAHQPEFERSATTKFGSLVRASEMRLYETGPIMSGTAYETETLEEAIDARNANKIRTEGQR